MTRTLEEADFIRVKYIVQAATNREQAAGELPSIDTRHSARFCACENPSCPSIISNFDDVGCSVDECIVQCSR